MIFAVAPEHVHSGAGAGERVSRGPAARQAARLGRQMRRQKATQQLGRYWDAPIVFIRGPISQTQAQTLTYRCVAAKRVFYVEDRLGVGFRNQAAEECK